jgi:hypothetical protein
MQEFESETWDKNRVKPIFDIPGNAKHLVFNS